MTKPLAQNPRWPQMIRIKRRELEETQAQFGKRFGVSHVAVSDWENGKSDPPGEVTWWLTYHTPYHEATS